MHRGEPPISLRLGLPAFLLACATSWAGPGLEDVVIRLSNNVQAEFRFRPDPGGGFPSFFQKIDRARNTALFSFLSAETPLPVERRALPPESPVEWVEIRRLRSPSGKEFLGVEFGFRSLPNVDWNLKPKCGHTLTLALWKAAKRGSLKEWSLSQVSAVPAPAKSAETPKIAVAQESNPVVAKAAPPAPALEAQASPKASAAPPAAPKTEAMAAPAAQSAPPVQLTEIRVGISGNRETVTLVFKGKETPDYKLESAPGAATAIGLILRNSTADPASAGFDLGHAGWTRGLRWKQAGPDLAVAVLLDSALDPKASSGNGKLTFSIPRRAGYPAFSWTTRSPETPKSKAEPTRSAHADGKALETQKGKGLTSSRVFTVAGPGKAMVLIRDSAQLLSVPGAKGKALRTLVAGETVRRLGVRAGHVQVLAGADSGFVTASALAYPDELAASQVKALESKVQARLAAEAAPPPPSEPVAAAPPKPVAKPPSEPEAAASPSEPPAPPTKVRAKDGSIAAAPKLSMPSPGDEARRGVPPEALRAERAVDSERVDLAPRDERVGYNSFGRRDPFAPVDPGNMENGIDIDQMKVVGIVWDNQEPLAVLEHVKESNLSFTVRQGDPVHNGRVSRILREAVTFDITEFGISRSFTLKLVPTQERAGK
jgi:hypothetical protein